MARPISIIQITERERKELQRRGEVVKQEQVAEQLGVSKACVNKWSQRTDKSEFP